jgi:hypothetical protein
MYCSSCGFTLRGVQQLLLTGGETSAESEANVSAVRRLLKRRGIRQGFVLLMLGAFIVPLLAITYVPDGVIEAASIIFFVGGFLRLLYALLFQESEQPRRAQNLNARHPSPTRPPRCPTVLKSQSFDLSLQPCPPLRRQHASIQHSDTRQVNSSSRQASRKARRAC